MRSKITGVKFLSLYEAVLDQVGAAPQTAPVKPATRPSPSPSKPAHPMKPRPGVSPKPKAKLVLTADARKFIAARLPKIKKALMMEEFKPTRHGEHINSDLFDRIQNGEMGLEEILPALSDGESSYLQAVATEAYEKVFTDLEGVIGKPLTNQELPGLMMGMMYAMSDIARIEEGHHEYLEHLAVTTILNLKEFKLIKDMVDNDDVKIDAKIVRHNQMGEKLKDSGEATDGLTAEEETNLDIYNALDEDAFEEEVLRRSLANAFIHGNAVAKIGSYQLVIEDLEEIDPKLPNLYGMLAGGGLLGYWASPDMDEDSMGMAMQGGEAEIDSETIKARGINFIMLVHELVKGVMEYSMANALPENDTLSQAVQNVSDGVNKERPGLTVGSELYKRVHNLIQDEEVAMLVVQQLLRRPKDQIKEVMAQSGRGRAVIKELEQDARGTMDQYNDDVADHDARDF